MKLEVTCNKCGKKYKVPKDKIKGKKAKLKCGSCQNVMPISTSSDLGENTVWISDEQISQVAAATSSGKPAKQKRPAVAKSAKTTKPIVKAKTSGKVSERTHPGRPLEIEKFAEAVGLPVGEAVAEEEVLTDVVVEATGASFDDLEGVNGFAETESVAEAVGVPEEIAEVEGLDTFEAPAPYVEPVSSVSAKIEPSSQKKMSVKKEKPEKGVGLFENLRKKFATGQTKTKLSSFSVKKKSGKKEKNAGLWGRLRTKMVVGVTLVAVIPTLIIGLFAWYDARETTLAIEIDAHDEIVKTLKGKVDTFLADAQSDIVFLGQSLAVAEYMKNRAEQRRSNEITIGEPAIVELSEREKRSEKRRVRKNMNREFLLFLESKGNYFQIGFVDEVGDEKAKVISQNGVSRVIPEGELQNVAGLNFFIGSANLQKGEVYVSDLTSGEASLGAGPTLTYATPAFLDNGDFQGVVVTTIFANSLFKSFAQAKGSDIYLVGGESFEDVLYSSRGSAQPGQGLDVARDFGVHVSALRNLASDTFETDKGLFAFQKIGRKGAPMVWALVGFKSKTDVMASTYEFAMLLSFIVMGALLFSLFYAIVFSGRIIRPIDYLIEVADRVSLGELDIEVATDAEGEIGELANSFERMRMSMVMALARLKRRK